MADQSLILLGFWGRRHKAVTVLPCEHLAVALSYQSPIYHPISSALLYSMVRSAQSVGSHHSESCRVARSFQNKAIQLKAGRFQPCIPECRVKLPSSLVKLPGMRLGNQSMHLWRDYGTRTAVAVSTVFLNKTGLVPGSWCVRELVWSGE